MDIPKIDIGSAALGAGAGAIIGGVAGFAVGRSISKKNRKRKTRKNKNSRERVRRNKRTKSKGRRTPRTAGRGRDTSTRRIRYTKKGQPYVITSNGRAKFIKKTSAHNSYKRKGGRY